MLADLAVAAVLAVPAFFALLMLFEGLRKRPVMVVRRPRALTFLIWCVFQVTVTGAVAVWSLTCATCQEVTPRAALIVGAAIAAFLTFVATRLADWSRRFFHPQRIRRIDGDRKPGS